MSGAAYIAIAGSSAASSSGGHCDYGWNCTTIGTETVCRCLEAPPADPAQAGFVLLSIGILAVFFIIVVFGFSD